jgi:hypothetical protein
MLISGLHLGGGLQGGARMHANKNKDAAERVVPYLHC